MQLKEQLLRQSRKRMIDSSQFNIPKQLIGGVCMRVCVFEGVCMYACGCAHISVHMHVETIS